MDVDSTAVDTLSRTRRWIVVAIAISVVGYVGYAIWADFSKTSEQIGLFYWPLYLGVLATTGLNYLLRFAKWHGLLLRLDIRPKLWPNLWIFMTGLAMAISPGRAGELVKPYLIKRLTGTPMARTIPVLVTERATDGMAVVSLAALGVSTYQANSIPLIIGTLLIIVLGLMVVSFQPLGNLVIRGIGALPYGSRVAPKFTSAYDAMRTCVSPSVFLVTYLLSLIAWFSECVGYWLVWKGLQVKAPLFTCTFLYAFATFFGAPSPGGLGLADGALGGTAELLLGVTSAQAAAAAILIRIGTLWVGVLLGGLMMLRVETIVEKSKE